MKPSTMKRSVISMKRAEFARAELERAQRTAPRPRLVDDKQEPRVVEDKPRELVAPSSIAAKTRKSSHSQQQNEKVTTKDVELAQSVSEAADQQWVTANRSVGDSSGVFVIRGDGTDPLGKKSKKDEKNSLAIGTEEHSAGANALDQWLTENKSTSDASSGVIIIRGDGDVPIARKKGANPEKKNIWESIFGVSEEVNTKTDAQISEPEMAEYAIPQQRKVTEADDDNAPRRSQPQSVVAPEEVELQASASKTMSVVSAITQATFENDKDSRRGRRNLYRPSKRTMLRPVGTAAMRKKTATPASSLKISPTESKKSTRSTRRKPRLEKFGKFPNDDDDASIASYTTATNSVDSKIFAPPAFRSFNEGESTAKGSAGGEISNPADKWSLLGWIGNGPQNILSSEPPKVGRKNKSLTENLVEAEGGAADIPSKVPTSDGNVSKLKQLVCTSSFLYAIMFVAMASGMLYGVLSNSRLSYSISDVDITIDWDEELNVAFVGNSYLFINDVPRIMEAISENHIHQESVIHSSGGSLGNLLLTGNGMYPRWMTDDAVIDFYTDGYGRNVTIYDYGLCSVAQILTSYDEIISYGNEDGAYYNDGRNPCIRDQNYFIYIEDKLANSSFVWDYVVLVDQTKRMAVEEARQQSIYALANAYGPLIKETGAVPVIVDTHAFWSESTNMTGLVDIPTFQALIYDGVLDYVEALANVLPDWQAPVVAPVGLAFLVVYEENYYLWQKLFIDDEIHSSVHGSYLFSCVLYATMFGHLPKRSTNSQVDALFANSRLLVGQDIEYPSAQEAFYYRRVAKRVALDGYLPSSLARR